MARDVVATLAVALAAAEARVVVRVDAKVDAASRVALVVLDEDVLKRVMLTPSHGVASVYLWKSIIPTMGLTMHC